MTRDHSETIWQGIIAGLIGYATVALLVGFIDVALGHSFFYTAALMGEHLFYGLSDPANLVVWPGAVFAYNGLHLVAFVFIGIVAAWLAFMSEHGPELWYLAAILLLFVLLHAFAAVLLLTEDIRAAIPAWTIVIPTLASVIAMGAYLIAMRPVLRHDLVAWQEE